MMVQPDLCARVCVCVSTFLSPLYSSPLPLIEPVDTPLLLLRQGQIFVPFYCPMLLYFASNPANSAGNVPLVHRECGGFLMNRPTIQVLSKFSIFNFFKCSFGFTAQLNGHEASV